MTAYQELWLAAFIKTQVIEVSVGWLTLSWLCRQTKLGSKSTLRNLSILTIASTLTHPPLWFVLPPLCRRWGFSYQYYLLIGESSVFLIEAIWYWFALLPLQRSLTKALLLSLLLNSMSYFVGIYLWK